MSRNRRINAIRQNPEPDSQIELLDNFGHQQVDPAFQADKNQPADPNDVEADMGEQGDQPQVETDASRMNFTEIKKKYIEETTITVPFARSTFVHYSKCPRNMRIDGKEYKDLVLTMELVQIPKDSTFNNLKFPTQTSGNDKSFHSNKQGKVNSENRPSGKKQRGKRTRRQDNYGTEQTQAIDERSVDPIDPAQQDQQDPEVELEATDDEALNDQQVDDQEDNENDKSNALDKSVNYKSRSTSALEKSFIDKDNKQNVNYGGDMYNSRQDDGMRLYRYKQSQPAGELNAPHEVIEQCNFSIWSSSNTLVRYRRLKDVTIPIPCLASDHAFRIANDAKRLYYLGVQNGINKLVVVYIRDLSYKVYDLGVKAQEIKTLEHSTLVRQHLCFMLPEERETDEAGVIQEKKNFFVLNLATSIIDWELPDCLHVQFIGVDSNKLELMKDFVNDSNFERNVDQQEDTDFEEGSQHDTYRLANFKEDQSSDLPNIRRPRNQNQTGEDILKTIHRGIMVVKAQPDKTEASQGVEAGAAAAAAALGLGSAAVQGKVEIKPSSSKHINVYYPRWRQSNFNFVERTQFTIQRPENAFYTTKVEEWEQKVPKQETILNEAGQQQDGVTPRKKLLENEVVVTADSQLKTVFMIVKGVDGSQHTVTKLEIDLPQSDVYRAGSTDLEFNVNAHIRTKDEIFLIQTDRHGQVTAKLAAQLEVKIDEEQKNEMAANVPIMVPPIKFTEPKKGEPKDCWIVDGDDVEANIETDYRKVMTICMSDCGEYIISDAIIPLNNPDLDEGEKFSIDHRSLKFEAQQIYHRHPCFASNIGNSKILIQSVTKPDQIACLELDKMKSSNDQQVTFVCFAEYNRLSDIGLQDKRKDTDSQPWHEKAQRIAFFTRTKDVCQRRSQKQEACIKGDLMLNVLEVNPYSVNTQFRLHTSNFEACMDEGISDDYVQKCFTFELTSGRGLDVTCAIQYRDRIIFDCITFPQQNPIRFPMLPSDSRDPDKNPHRQFDQLEIAKNCTMVPQHMLQGEKGKIFWMMRDNDNADTVRVLCADPEQEMGSLEFITTVFTLRSKEIYFLLQHQGLFYIMDDDQKVRVCRENVLDKTWELVETKELMKEDANKITYTDYEEFAISPKNLHYKDYLFYLFNPSDEKSNNFKLSQYNLADHKVTYGPKHGRDTGMIFSIQKNLQTDTKEGYQGTQLVVQPLTDSSFVDIFPVKDTIQNNFITFLNKDEIMAKYAGRYVVMDRKGKLLTHVKFAGSDQGFQQSEVKLKFVSASHRYFVFKGPKFESGQETKTKNKEIQKLKNRMALVRRQRRLDEIPGLQAQIDELQKDANTQYYPFRLEVETITKQGKTQDEYRFQALQVDLVPDPAQQSELTTFRVSHRGRISECTIKEEANQVQPTLYNLKVMINFGQCKTKEAGQVPNNPDQQRNRNFFNWPWGPLEESKKEQHTFSFGTESRDKMRDYIDTKINNLKEKKKNYGTSNDNVISQFTRRKEQIQRAWVFRNFVIAKSGTQLQYRALGPHEVSNSRLENNPITTPPFDLKIYFEPEAWIENIYATGVEDLVQILVINDAKRHVFVITWDLRQNKEHSIFQTDFDEEAFAENLILRSNSYIKELDFNYFLDKRTILDMQDNLPVQFFDMVDDPKILPTKIITTQVEGVRRLMSDRSRYLDIMKPGRIHHFSSLTDILYFERLANEPFMHELTRSNTITQYQPFVRFYDGKSIFHHFASDNPVLQVVTESYKVHQAKRNDNMLRAIPLLFLQSNPLDNKIGAKYTPIHIAFGQKSPLSFELMFELLVDQPRNCVTTQLFDVIDQIIETGSDCVHRFFNSCFYVTDQFSGPHALVWPEDLAEEDELHVESNTAYLSQQMLQELAGRVEPKAEENGDPEEDEIQLRRDAHLNRLNPESRLKRVVNQEQTDSEKHAEPQVVYDEFQTRMTRSTDFEDSSIKQVDAKILDFSWVFTGEFARNMIKILANTSNDEIFAQKQIQVFVDFMWDNAYYNRIFWWMFIPFVTNFFMFIVYSTYFPTLEEPTEADEKFEIAILVFYFVSLAMIICQEIVTICYSKCAYFKDKWNYLDIASIILNSCYVIFFEMDMLTKDQKNVLGSFCVVLMYIKMFYWMRLFRSYSAFIRMIGEIIASVEVFFVMMFLCLAAYANVMFILNLNRGEGCVLEDDAECDEIYEAAFGNRVIDAFVHAYLTGLGDFRTDSYEHADSGETWFMFIAATVLVQMIFMNVLITIMGGAYETIMEIMDQATLQELCKLMEDHIWICNIKSMYKDKKYIVSLTAPNAKSSGATALDKAMKKIEELQKQMLDKQAQSLEKVEFVSEGLDGTLDMFKQSQQKQKFMSDDIRNLARETDYLRRQIMYLRQSNEKLTEPFRESIIEKQRQQDELAVQRKLKQPVPISKEDYHPRQR